MNPDDLPSLSELEFVGETGDCEEHLAIFLKNTSDYVGKALVTNRNVPGRLLNPDFEDFYRNVIKAPNDMCEVYASGYEIPFENGPPSMSADQKQCFLCQAARVLLARAAASLGAWLC